ncbi:hypothetical protein GLOIN_2v1580557 [Rhizophagus clarus]|uniref:Uncharacterized protein n=1 Tax=Rhizophagus clarus TaxID=94130 RepID=A0A8H3R3J2_9GLOM|nr:hypothetical protein GLOIN_2v1580557 [Rhizophagus clarus]
MEESEDGKKVDENEKHFQTPFHLESLSALSVFPPFNYGYKNLDGSSQAVLKHLMAELIVCRFKSISINRNETSKSQYVCSYLVAREIDLLKTTKTLGVTEVKG